MEFPEGLHYTQEHEWLRVEDGVGIVGITDFAQHELGDVVFVELPTKGTRLAKGQTFGAVESVKAVSDIYAPVGGTVLEVNEEIEEKPELVNEQPFGAGWLIKIQVSDPAEIADLMDAQAYREYTRDKES
jgi:glycine cleavage system H protein